MKNSLNIVTLVKKKDKLTVFNSFKKATEHLKSYPDLPKYNELKEMLRTEKFKQGDLEIWFAKKDVLSEVKHDLIEEIVPKQFGIMNLDLVCKIFELESEQYLLQIYEKDELVAETGVLNSLEEAERNSLIYCYDFEKMMEKETRK